MDQQASPTFDVSAFILELDALSDQVPAEIVAAREAAIVDALKAARADAGLHEPDERLVEKVLELYRQLATHAALVVCLLGGLTVPQLSGSDVVWTTTPKGDSHLADMQRKSTREPSCPPG